MSNELSSNLTNYLSKFSEKDWFAAVGKVVSEIHEVDKNATQIWFRFFPLELHRYLQAAEDKAKAVHKFAMQGNFELKDQIDSSHNFLYGHRFWKQTKAVIENFADSFGDENADLSIVIGQIADTAAEKAHTKKSLTLGISAVGLMTLNQVGIEAFKAAKGEPENPIPALQRSPSEIVEDRAKDDSQGIFGFLRTVDKKFTANWINSKSSGSFSIKNDADIATASALDQSKNWKDGDERCWEGVVPVECRSAACGTCWVGILDGEEKLSEVQRLERKQMSVFGYNQPSDEKPFMRLACQAKASGNVSFVIPPWNGVFGKKVYGVEEGDLEPVTTSAKKLRETLKTATSGE